MKSKKIYLCFMEDCKNNKPILIMTYVSLSTFVKRDIFLLSDDYQVIYYHFNTSNKWKLPLVLFKQAWFLLKNRNQIDLIVTQSAGYLSFLPSLFFRFTEVPLVIIAIGTDCIKLPEIGYGAHSKVILSWFTRFSFKNAALILPVHKSLAYNEYSYFPIRFPQQGIKAFTKNISTPIIEVVNGFDIFKWFIKSHTRLKNSFLTVTTAIDKTGFSLKGIDMIVQMAEKFPHFHFTIVGKVVLENGVPSNVQLIENVPHEQLLDIYNQHEYYLQLSMSEGFPNALCEAMLCGCIPIGSHVAGIPDIIGSAGYLLKNKDKEELENIFHSLLSNEIKPETVRERIVTNFPIEKRKKDLLQAIKGILS